MKRKNYFHFVVGRAIASLLIGAVCFGLVTLHLSNMYSNMLDRGFEKRDEMMKKLVDGYDEGKYDHTFISIFTNLYTADYIKFSKVDDDGNLETVYETDYNVVPIQDNLHHWYYVTKDPALLAKGKSSVFLKDENDEWSIEYKKSDEVWKLCELISWNRTLTNGWDLCSMADSYYADKLVCLATDMCGTLNYAQPDIHTYYVEGDVLHVGKVKETGFAYLMDEFGQKAPVKWDFTDPSKADLYKGLDDDNLGGSLYMFPPFKRPDKFLKDNEKIFMGTNVNDIIRAGMEARENEAYAYMVYGNQYDQRYDFRFFVSKENNDSYVKGLITGYSVNGNKYVVEYVMTTAPFLETYRTFLIPFGIVIFVLCMAIALLSAIRPYTQYKKAYENNNFKNNLIDSLAHNMKTPLQILGGYAENLKDVQDGGEKDRYADQILSKTNEMNKDIEAILKTAEKSDRKFVKTSVRTAIAEVAEKAGAEAVIKGDTDIKMDKDYFKTAVFCLIDNALKYKTADSKIEVDITGKGFTFRNKTEAAKFTPGTGLAIAGRIFEQHKLYLKTELKDGVFEARVSRKPAK